MAKSVRSTHTSPRKASTRFGVTRNDAALKIIYAFHEAKRQADIFYAPDEDLQLKVVAATSLVKALETKRDAAAKAHAAVGERIKLVGAARSTLDEQIRATDPDSREQLGKLAGERSVETATLEALAPRLLAAEKDVASADEELKAAREALLAEEVRLADDELQRLDLYLLYWAEKCVEHSYELRERFNRKMTYVRVMDSELQHAKGFGPRQTIYTGRGTIWGDVPEHLPIPDAMAHALKHRQAQAEAKHRYLEEVNRAHAMHAAQLEQVSVRQPDAASLLADVAEQYES